jgi:hypothetical protein
VTTDPREILACAASLREFDVATVAAFCEADPAEVEAVLEAHGNVFDRRAPRHGPPDAPTRWRVSDPKMLAHLLSVDAGRSLVGLTSNPHGHLARMLEHAASLISAYSEERDEAARRAVFLKIQRQVGACLDHIGDGADSVAPGEQTRPSENGAVIDIDNHSVEITLGSQASHVLPAPDQRPLGYDEHPPTRRHRPGLPAGNPSVLQPSAREFRRA